MAEVGIAILAGVIGGTVSGVVRTALDLHFKRRGK